MQFNPHDYQQYAIEYIESHEVAAVLLDMGLGKTAITLTALYHLLFDYFEITRVLVIAPLRVARNTWPQEIEKWDHLKDIRYSVAVGTEKERLAAFQKDADIYIINRKNVQWMVDHRGSHLLRWLFFCSNGGDHHAEDAPPPLRFPWLSQLDRWTVLRGTRQAGEPPLRTLSAGPRHQAALWQSVAAPP